MDDMARVLVAEDDGDILLLLETVLDDAGFTVAGASTVAAALRILQGGGIDCVLTDLGMPGQSGMVLAETAKAAGIPVVLATGSMPRSDALEAAGWRLLRKPFRMQDLVTTVRAALAVPRDGSAPVVPEFLEIMAERCGALADRAEIEDLGRELGVLAAEMRSRARRSA
jgi:DNA-binding response OmpR family regulator